MNSIAILIGNVSYDNASNLECCRADVSAIHNLLTLTEKYELIHTIIDKNSDELKEDLRKIFNIKDKYDEVFFYFTGHGCESNSNFYYCPTNFDSKRPNETGLSDIELNAFLRSTSANLVVKVIDACNSGTPLIKSERIFPELQKSGFNNIIQIASCLDSQNALPGTPLSLFTEKFQNAALRKTEGIIYYTDIIDTLRDDFLGNNSQTPHFISQGTGREQFVDNAKKFDTLRNIITIENEDIANTQELENEQNEESILQLFVEADKTIPVKAVAQDFIEKIFKTISERIAELNGIGSYFNISEDTYSDFRDESPKKFIVAALSQENRQDNFVTAKISNDYRKLRSYTFNIFDNDRELVTTHTLYFNCRLEKLQLKISAIPKFKNLKQLNLLITVAPSLKHCDIFEYVTEHSLSDWETFESNGKEINRKWYQRSWEDDGISATDAICSYFEQTIRSRIDGAAKQLSSPIVNS